jgi:hypothetical protein
MAYPPVVSKNQNHMTITQAIEVLSRNRTPRPPRSGFIAVWHGFFRAKICVRRLLHGVS